MLFTSVTLSRVESSRESNYSRYVCIVAYPLGRLVCHVRR